MARFSLYKRKSSQLWLVHNTDLHVEVYLNNQRFYLFHASTYFHLWASLSVIRKFFKQIHLYTILIQAISITIIGQIPTNLVFEEVHPMLSSKFSSLQPSVTILKNDKAKFKAAVRKCQHTHPFNPVDEFFMCKENL